MATVVPNRNDQASVFGAFQASSPYYWYPDKYNLSPGSTIEFVFEIMYVPNIGRATCGTFLSSLPAARNGTWVATCPLPSPNSTLTSILTDYVNFNLQPERNCCQQSYFSWVSGPSGNLTEFQSNGGFFETTQAGNYSVHISNTNFLPPPAVPVGNVNGTLTFSDGYILFSRPYFRCRPCNSGSGGLVLGLHHLLISHRRAK